MKKVVSRPFVPHPTILSVGWVGVSMSNFLVWILFGFLFCFHCSLIKTREWMSGLENFPISRGEATKVFNEAKLFVRHLCHVYVYINFQLVQERKLDGNVKIV